MLIGTFFTVLLLEFFQIVSLQESEDILNNSDEDVLVYGPGLKPDVFNLPVRYFFIEAKDLSSKVLENGLKVDIKGLNKSGQNCRIWSQLLNRRDGSFIARYRIYETCTSIEINVRLHEKHIGKSPFKIKGYFHAEACHCPTQTVEAWMKNVCPPNFTQIHEDLFIFGKVDMDDMLKETIKRLYQPGARSFCDYVVKDNQIYRKCYGQHVGFNMFMDSILLSLSRKMVLPDFEFIANLGDWPLVDKNIKPILAIFSWCSSDTTHDIVMPTYDLTQSIIEMMDRVTLDIFSVQSNNDIPWEAKKPVAFWRGRDSREERLDLIDIARQHPSLFNVSLTNFFFFRDKEKKYGPKQKHESFFKFFDYKYQINIDGTVAAYRLPYLLGGSSLVLKQESPYYEHFYKQLKPYVHYVPFKRDLSDLVEKINWAIEHDEQSKLIAKNARKFVNENLTPQHVFCYYAQLINEWSKKLTSKIKVRDQMELVSNENNSFDCHCEKGKHKSEL